MNTAAVEFQSVVEDDIIRIPEKYRGQFSSPVVVTIREKRIPKIIPRNGCGTITDGNFTAMRINTKDYQFDREEANER